MPKNKDDDSGSQELIVVKNLLTTEVYTMEALRSILEKKGLVTRDEIVEEITKMSGRP